MNKHILEIKRLVGDLHCMKLVELELNELEKLIENISFPSDEDIHHHIKTKCRHNNGEPMMDEQTFYEGAKWAREYKTDNK